jgi:hypothetical protein
MPRLPVLMLVLVPVPVPVLFLMQLQLAAVQAAQPVASPVQSGLAAPPELRLPEGVGRAPARLQSPAKAWASLLPQQA